MNIADTLKKLGITLPPPPPAVAAYKPWIRAGNFVFTSGQLPWVEGKLAYRGKLGAELNEADGYQAARLAALNAIAQLQAATGNLERVRQIVRVEGYIHAAPGFRAHPQVLNGASDLINAIFGERAGHARLALGINEMPLDSPIQLALIAEVSEDAVSK